MNDVFNIRNYFRPVQPIPDLEAANVAYREKAPRAELVQHIHCYWELKTPSRMESGFTYRVVADGCVDVFFQLTDPSASFVMGFCRKFTDFELGNYFHYVGIRFFPSVFPALFNVDAAELSNRTESLKLVSPVPADFIAHNLAPGLSFKHITAKFDQYFINLLAKRRITLDARFQHALHVVLKNSGSVHVTKDLDTGLSPRQMRRYFEYYIGDGAKTFSQVVRFQRILAAQSAHQGIKENRHTFDHRYYDQAHFIKDFKKYSGTTPGHFFGR